MSAGADFSRNCMDCEHLRTELWPLRGEGARKPWLTGALRRDRAGATTWGPG